ncbi:YmdB family metallophosphoesterase [Patescibacteria group bacterium]|nr:YmdB family metallophosphoesterase [Patescibacteria group bacterium]MBU1663404.1 YmdB family metallophosphoesterase [Patescibacteria group bacterium]MBU1933898.1 YmdB family metallophosphoesterase [Patescibacteria group bacterium]MBU2007771.1 YmdB family metallophosphoesterase [Patescibacteria group bacterium]MBU2263722.1 YmdB family metallophosphoesterase [Patescibacteria group bacterium]
MLNILFIGEVNGKIGRRVVQAILPKLKKQLKPDFVIVNADNLAHGNGVSGATIKEMLAAGVDALTGGDHCFGNTGSLNVYDSDLPLLRPANYSKNAPGKGFTVIELKNGHKILLISLIGQVFMSMNYDNPFIKVDEILSNLAKNNLSAIIIDIHAEATSEKIALAHYLDGRISAVIGTHTHIMTADARITTTGTALITDVGMTGFADGVLGTDKQGIIKTFLTQIKTSHVIPENGRAIFNAVFLQIDPDTKKTLSIKSITKYININ